MESEGKRSKSNQRQTNELMNDYGGWIVFDFCVIYGVWNFGEWVCCD